MSILEHMKNMPPLDLNSNSESKSPDPLPQPFIIHKLNNFLIRHARFIHGKITFTMIIDNQPVTYIFDPSNLFRPSPIPEEI